MQIIDLWNTLYVFQEKSLVAIFKMVAGKLEVSECYSDEHKKLHNFLQDKGYII